MKSYAYYPGCASESTGIGQGLSIKAIAKPLGMELIELESSADVSVCPLAHLHRLSYSPLLR